MRQVHFLHSLTAAAAIAAIPFSAASAATDILARVISSTPVVQQVAVPRQVCNNQQYLTDAPRSGGGAVLGALAGGVAGNALGNGGGRALATAIGLVGGAIVGDQIEGGGRQQVQNVQQCNTQTFYENRPSHYNVVYEYQGTQYNAQMATDPGLYVRLQVTPVGGMAGAPQAGFSGQAEQAQAQSLNQAEPVPQPGYVVQQPTAGQTVITTGTTYYGAAPVYYGQPYQQPYQQPHQQPYYQPYYQSYPRPYFYAPYVAPIGLSLNFGFGNGYRGGWR
ncbi:MAG: glycine zipper 2TM domain-containing protein [Polaromonas sp.]|nr:glycine zipper 2TM domain-containing protein [Polaromonas sp.]